MEVRTFSISLDGTTKEERNALADFLEAKGETIMPGSNMRTRTKGGTYSVFAYKPSGSYWMTRGAENHSATTISIKEFYQRFKGGALGGIYG